MSRLSDGRAVVIPKEPRFKCAYCPGNATMQWLGDPALRCDEHGWSPPPPAVRARARIVSMLGAFGMLAGLGSGGCLVAWTVDRAPDLPVPALIVAGFEISLLSALAGLAVFVVAFAEAFR